MSKPFTLSDPPNRLNDTKSLQAWQELFRSRQAWVARAVEDCARTAQATIDRYGEMDVMMRCLDAAIVNLESVVKTLNPKYQELKKWAAPAQTEYNMLVTRWEAYLGLARSIPISADMATFMTGRKMNSKSRPSRQPTLEDLLDLDTVRRTGRQAPQALRNFKQRVSELEKTATRMFQNCQVVTRDFERVIERSAMSHDGEAARLLEDIEALAKKIDADYQLTLELSNTSKDLTQASKLAALHTERLLPSIKERTSEMDEMLRYASKARNALALESVDFMRSITDITSSTSSVKSQMNVLGSEEELATFDYLRLIQQVPFMYASFSVEAMRRREWYEKVKVDANTLANEMAVFQDEETKRRRKWLKTVENLYGPQAHSPTNSVVGLEVNLLGQEDQWPEMTKADLTDFYETLKTRKAEPDLLDDIGKLIVELNTPTKQQAKRMKAFKNGSIHETSLGRSGLMIRGDEDNLRILREEKERIQSKLATANSRVKRLEDLLHRQSAASRPSLQNIFQPSSQQLPTVNGSSPPVTKGPEDRRRSSVEMPDGMLQQRIQQLEGELIAEKEKSSLIEKDLSARTKEHEAVVGQMEEVNSTKTDLMENMEALKKEFIGERKSLEDEIKQLKVKIEDNEDEMEHFGESRENEKVNFDEKVHTFEIEILRLNNERRDETLKYEGQVEFLRKESKLQREQVDSLEKQLKSAQDENKTLSKRLETADQSIDSQLKALQATHRQLAPDEDIPQDEADLIESVSHKCADIFEKFQTAEGSMSIIQKDLDAEQARAKDLRAEVTRIEELMSEKEDAILQLQKNLGEEKARANALEGELDETRKQLDDLRGKVSSGEADSGTLRQKLEEEEKRVTSLTEDLASKQSQVGSLEEELRLFKDKFDESQGKLGVLTERFVARTEHAKDLTQKLYTQNDRLCRLLERLGFSVTRKDSSVVITKIPRAERSANLNDSAMDPGASLRRSGTLSKTPDSNDLELLYWMNNADQATEAEKYQAFMSELGIFDMDAFTETLYKRVKDIEHMARKLQRDARSYRDKAHALQKEAHDKIAFKNFKDGDLALFLPTRNQMTGAWAAFNIGFPHYFLREQETHRLRNREWLLARIGRIQERVVDLSKSLSNHPSGTGTSEADLVDDENDNPFDLSDGLRWYLIDAHEDKPGAPSTPGLGKTTVAANKVDAVAERSHVRNASGKGLGLVGRPSTGINGVSKSLSKSLESRRSSTSSRRAMPFGIGVKGSALASEANSGRATAAESPEVPAESGTQQAQSAAPKQAGVDQATGGAAYEAAGSPKQAGAAEIGPAGQEEQRPAEDMPNSPEVRHEVGYDDLLGP